MNRAELARRLDWHRESVDRLFRLDHASRVDQIEAAFKVLQQDVDVRVTHKRGTAVA
jgi:antitoxin HicB